MLFNAFNLHVGKVVLCVHVVCVFDIHNLSAQNLFHLSLPNRTNLTTERLEQGVKYVRS